MASKVVQQQPKGDEEKPKNGAAEGRHRKVLGDIGNVVNAPTNITRPITRSFCAQLLANAQAQEEKKKKPVVVDANPQAQEEKKKKAVVVVDANPQAQEEKKKKAVVVDANPEAYEEKKKKAVVLDDVSKAEKKVTGRTPNKCKKRAKSLTAILSARSKAVCGIASRPVEPVVNIDADDVGDELAEVPYVEDIYKFYKEVEKETLVPDYMGTQTEVNNHMRSILVDWLIEVHNKFELMPETLYLAINLVDRYLAIHATRRRELQLVGMGAMLIACKYEEIWAPEVNDFVCISDNAYGRDHVLYMEKTILSNLEWSLTVPTPWVFLVRYVKASLPVDQEVENMTFLLAELGLMNYSLITGFCPSIMAASAVYAARVTLDRRPFWTETLKHYTGYKEEKLVTAARVMVKLHSGIAENKLRAVYKKFSRSEKGSVALLPPAKSLCDE